ncbi:MAG: hypothetical protein ACI898_000039 [Flavobacteriales bacterium]|jgi:hypothetical protein
MNNSHFDVWYEGEEQTCFRNKRLDGSEGMVVILPREIKDPRLSIVATSSARGKRLILPRALTLPRLVVVATSSARGKVRHPNSF